MPIVKFMPSGKEVEVAPGETLLQAARREGIPIASTCGGIVSCTDCRVKILEGEGNLTPMDFAERSRLGTTFHLTRERLACQTRVLGPVTVEVLREEAGDKRERARRKALARARELAARRAERSRHHRAPPGGGGDGKGRTPAPARPAQRRPPRP